jgi:hypothetical protein
MPDVDVRNNSAISGTIVCVRKCWQSFRTFFPDLSMAVEFLAYPASKRSGHNGHHPQLTVIRNARIRARQLHRLGTLKSKILLPHLLPRKDEEPPKAY